MNLSASHHQMKNHLESPSHRSFSLFHSNAVSYTHSSALLMQILSCPSLYSVPHDKSGSLLYKNAQLYPFLIIFHFFNTSHTPQSYINVFSLGTVWACIQILLKRNVLNVTDCQIRSQARSESRFYQLITADDQLPLGETESDIPLG